MSRPQPDAHHVNMIDLNKYGLLYRLQCLQGLPVTESDDLKLLHTYFSEGLVSGSFPIAPMDSHVPQLTPDGHVLVQAIKRQIRFSVRRNLPQFFTQAMRELPSTVSVQE